MPTGENTLFSLQDPQVANCRVELQRILDDTYVRPLLPSISVERRVLTEVRNWLIAGNQDNCFTADRYPVNVIQAFRAAALTEEQKALVCFFYAFTKFERLMLHVMNHISSASPLLIALHQIYQNNFLRILHQRFYQLHWLFNRRLSRQKIRYPVADQNLERNLKSVAEILQSLQTLKPSLFKNRESVHYRNDGEQDSWWESVRLLLEGDSSDIFTEDYYHKLVSAMRAFYILPWQITSQSYRRSITDEFVSILKKLYFVFLLKILRGEIELVPSGSLVTPQGGAPTYAQSLAAPAPSAPAFEWPPEVPPLVYPGWGEPEAEEEPPPYSSTVA